MNDFHGLSERITHAGLGGVITLMFFASPSNQTIYAGSNPTTSSQSQKEMRPSSAASPESPLTKGSCKKTPMQCSSLCQSALVAESRAATLDKSSKEAQAKADKAARKAASLAEKTNRQFQKMGMSNNAGGSGSASRGSRSFWRLVALIPRAFVSKDANARYKKEEEEAEKHSGNPLPDHSSYAVTELFLKSQTASKSADESQKAAADAKMAADQARAFAESMWQSYKSCLQGD